MARNQPGEPTQALWLVMLVLALIGGTVVCVTAPGERLLGGSSEAIRGALHGAAAGMFMVTATIGLFQAYRLYVGQVEHVVDLQLGSVANAMVALFTILLGNWVYIPYRAPGGPRQYFIDSMPEVHKIFFEFKEFAALFTLPFAVAAAYIFVAYGGTILQRRDLRTLASTLLTLVFFYFLVAFTLGAAVTKLRAV